MIKKRFISMLVLLAAVATGAWADETPLVTIESKDYTSFKSGSKTFDDKVTITFSYPVTNNGNEDGWYTYDESLLTVAGTNDYTITSCKFYTEYGTANAGYTVKGASPSVYLIDGEVYTDNSASVYIGNQGIKKIEVYGYETPAAPAGYTVSMPQDTPDAGKWTARAGTDGTYQQLPLEGVAAGTAVSVKYNGTKKVKSVKAVKKAAASLIVNPVVGQIIGSDGKNYDANATLPDGVTKVAMIAYLGNGSDCTNGLAIQLNASPESKNWNDAKTYASGLTAVPGGTWRLPSKDDWQNMFVGCAKSGDAGAGDTMNPIAGFKEKIGATGITWQSGYYWSSTDRESQAWGVRVYFSGTIAFAGFYGLDTSNPWHVLGCLAF